MESLGPSSSTGFSGDLRNVERKSVYYEVDPEP